MNYFKEIIKCKCGKNYNFKLNRNTPCYICQNRKNKGVQECNAPILKESDLIYYIQKHCELQNKDFTESKIKNYVRVIKVSKDCIKIFYKNGDVTEIYDNKIVF